MCELFDRAEPPDERVLSNFAVLLNDCTFNQRPSDCVLLLLCGLLPSRQVKVIPGMQGIFRRASKSDKCLGCFGITPFAGINYEAKWDHR